MSKTTTCRSKNAVEGIRKLLLNIELEIERVKGEIALCNETMGFYASSEKKSYQKAFLLSKIEKENYEVFLSRLSNLEKDIKKRVAAVCDKYTGDYSNIFNLYFFEKKSCKEIEQITGIERQRLYWLISRMRHDIIDYL